MSGRQVKVQKREMRRIMSGYLEEFASYLKPKPKWVPWFIWEAMQNAVLRMEKVRKRW